MLLDLVDLKYYFFIYSYFCHSTLFIIIFWLFYAPLKGTRIISIKDTSFPRELNKKHLVFKHLNFRCVKFPLQLVHTLSLNAFGFIILFFVSVLFIPLLSSSGIYTPNFRVYKFRLC